MMATIVAAGVALGAAIGHLVPGSGVVHFVAECAIWLAAIAVRRSPAVARATPRAAAGCVVPDLSYFIPA